MKGKTLKLLSLLLMVLLTLSCLFACDTGKTDTPTDTTPGTTDTPTPPKPEYVEIADAAALADAAAKIAANTDGYATKTFKLTADIVLTGDFAPIVGFKGVFDGQGHTISGLVIDSDLASVGLFSTLNGATVKNLNIVSEGVANTDPAAVVGVLAGIVRNAVISSVSVNGVLSCGGNRAVAGGIVAVAENTTLLNVASAVSVEGTASVAGGIVGRLGDGAMVVNAYSAGTYPVNASVKAAVGTKTADSAVAFLLAKDGDVVASSAADAFTPSYVIGCKVGVAASGMGWNAADWDVSGETPVLKAAAVHTAPAVTLDGKAVSAVYGEKLITTAPTLGAGKAFVGYAVGGDILYPALPVVNDMTLTTATVDYAALLGRYVPVNAADAALEVGASLSLGSATLTYKTAAVVDGLPVLLFTDAEGVTYRLSVKALSPSEKSSLGISADGAALLSLEKENDTGFDAAVLYMPVPGAAAGAWNIDGKVVIYTADVTSAGTQNAFRSLTVGTAVGSYKTCFAVKDGVVTVLADGAAVGTADGAPVLVKGGNTFTVAVAAYDGEWISAASKVVIADGKIGDTVLKAVSTAAGTGLLNEADGTLYVLNLSGLAAVKNDAAEQFVSSDFSGDWKAVKGGKVTLVTIDGNRVYFNGAADAAVGTIAPDALTGVAKLTVTVGDKTYVFVHDGISLVSDDLTLYAASAVNTLEGNFVLGTTAFSIADGKLTVIKAGVAGDVLPLDLVYADGTLGYNAGDMTFAPKDGRMHVTGYVSEVSGESMAFPLFSAAELAPVLASLKGDFAAASTGGVKYASLKMSFTEDGVLSFDGKAVSAYEFRLSGGDIVLVAKCTYEGKESAITVVPRANGLLSTYGVGVGAMMPVALYDAVGKYYEFLTGTGEEGEIPGYIYFYYDGKLSLNPVVNGTIVKTDYTIDKYSIATNGSTYVLTVRGEDGETLVTLTFNGNKTLTYGGNVWYNVDFVIPKDNYHEIGKEDGASFNVINGSVGYYYEDEDDGEEYWEDAVYPLYGFRYTDASGKVYKSADFAWARENGVKVISVRMAATDGTVLNLTVSYPDGNDFSRLSVKVGDAEAFYVYSESMISGMAGSYKNKDHSFVVSTAGVLKIDGVVTPFTYSVDGNVLTYVAGGKTYVLDTNVPEILKCGDEVFYDARFADFAGIELTDFKRGESAPNRRHTLLLTEEGFFFDGEKIVWGYYDKNSSNIRFNVTETIAGVPTEITWKLENVGSSYGSYGITLYPNYDGDWNQRMFVPAILLDADTGYTDGNTIVTIKQPDYTDGYTPFLIMLGETRYTYNDYTFSVVDGVFTLDLGDGNKLTFVKGEDGSLAATLNGAELTHYDPPSLDEFEMDTTQVFGTTAASNKVKVTGGQIIYNPGATYGETKVTAYSFGKWNGCDVIYFRAGGIDYALVLGQNGRVVPVVTEMFSLIGTFTVDGKKVVSTFDITGDTPVIKVTVGDTAATDVRLDSKLLPNDNHYFITYTAGGTTRYIVPDLIAGGAGLIADEAMMNSVGYVSLASYKRLSVWLTKDADGAAALAWKVADEVVTPVAVDGKTNVWSVTYGNGVTEYFGYVTSAASGHTLISIPEGAFRLLGSFTAANGKTYVAGIGLNADKYAAYTVAYDGKAAAVATYDSTALSFKFLYTDNGAEYTCYAVLADGALTVSEVNAKQALFVTGTGYSDGYRTPNKSYCYTKVAYANGVFTVTYDGKATENVRFSADNTRLCFTQGGVEYCIVILDGTQSYDYNKGVTLTAAQAAFVGTRTLDGKELIVSASAGYSPAIAVSFGGKTVSDVIFHSAKLLSFKGLADDGVTPDYKAVILSDDGTAILKSGILDTTALFYQFLGTFADRKLTFGYKLTLNETGDDVTAAYALLDASGNELVCSIDPVTLVITVGEGSDAKYYSVCAGSTKALALLTAADVAMLGEYTVDGVKVKLIPAYTASYNSRSETYSYTAGYKMSVNGGEAFTVKFEKDNGETPRQYVRYEKDSKTYLFFVVEAGVSAKLHELTDAQVALLGVNYSTIDSTGKKYLKTNLVFAEDGSFTLALFFDGAAISDETAVTYGTSFKAADGTTCYLITEGVTTPFILNADQYAVYVTDAAVGDNTVTVAPGSSASSPYKVTLNGTVASSTTYVQGEYPYIQFVVNGTTYILGFDTTNGNAMVLNPLTAEQAAALSLNVSSVKLLKKDGTQYASATLKAVITVDATGAVSIAYSYGSNPAPTSVEVITGFDASLYINKAYKVTIEGETTYVLLHGSYKSYMTEEQYAFVGIHKTVDGKDFSVGFDDRSYYLCLTVTYDGTQVISSYDAYSGNPHTQGTVLFKVVDGVTVIEFKIGDITYHASVVGGVVTVAAV